MNKVNNYIKKHINLILNILILLSPLLDLFVSLSINVFKHSLNIGIIVRMFILLFIYYTSFFIYKKRKIIIYPILITIYGLIFLIIQYDNTFIYNLHEFMRIYYFPLLLVAFYSIKDQIKIPDKTLIITVLTYIILIFIAVITNTGFQSYKISKVGSLGWFNSTNEISGIISILIPQLFYSLSKKDNYILKTILAIIFIYVISEIGTKTPMLSLVITFITTFFYILIKDLKNKKYIQSFSIIITTILLLITSIYLVPKTNFYKNIQIHTKYLKINNIQETLSNEYLFDHFIFSQRISFLNKTINRYNKASTKKKLFGMGYVTKNEKPYKEIEMDYYDILYNQGIIGFIMFFSIYIYILYKIFKNLPKKMNYQYLMKYLSLTLILILSLFSGHIITTPAVSIFVVIIIIDLLKKRNLQKQ